jgi:hypothetical protein
MKSGPLSKGEQDEIVRLRGRKKSPYLIAKLLDRKSTTIRWFVIQQGLATGKLRPRVAIQRDGRTIEPYAPEHDAHITALRIAGKSYTAIAKAVTTEFGIDRKWHSVRARLALLAAYDHTPLNGERTHV